MNAEQLITDILKIEEYYIKRIEYNTKQATVASNIKDMDISLSEEVSILDNDIGAQKLFVRSTVAIEDDMNSTIDNLDYLIEQYNKLQCEHGTKKTYMSLDDLNALTETVASEEFAECLFDLKESHDVNGFIDRFNELFELTNLHIENNKVKHIQDTPHDVCVDTVFDKTENVEPICLLALRGIVNDIMKDISNDFIEGVNASVFTIAVQSIVTPLKYLIAAKA